MIPPARTNATMRPPDDERALQTALATADARYRRAILEAERSTDASARQAALAEARRLAAHAGRLDARLRRRG
jgi:hypothetical protein